MKASEALRKGMRRVGGGQTFNKAYNGRSNRACALGGIAIGNKLIHKMNGGFFHPCRHADIKYQETYGVSIAEDNDNNRLTLKEIAQRLEDIGE